VIGPNKFSVVLALGALGKAALRYRMILVFGVLEFVAPLPGNSSHYSIISFAV